MDTWKTITAAIVSNTAVLAVLGWLAKSLIEKLLARDSKRFELEIKAKADSAIEELKSQLQIRNLEHQIKFSRLHETRATTIAEINSLLAEVTWEAENLLSVLEFSGEPGKQKKYVAAMMKLAEFFRHFDKNRIYLPASLCDPIEKVVFDVRQHVIKFGVYAQIENNEPLMPHTQKEKTEAWMSGWNALKTQVPAVRSQLEDEFRKLLAPGV